MHATRERQTVTVSLPPELAAEVDRVAGRENRTRSELLREAFRQYVERRERWDAILAKTEARGRELGPKSDDEIVRIVKEHRRQKRESRVAAGKR